MWADHVPLPFLYKSQITDELTGLTGLFETN